MPCRVVPCVLLDVLLDIQLDIQCEAVPSEAVPWVQAGHLPIVVLVGPVHMPWVLLDVHSVP